MKKEKTKKDIVIYQAKNGEIRFRGDFSGGTIWATQKQIAKIFSVTSQNVTIHMRNIFKEKELQKKATCKESLQVQREGKRRVTRKIKEYNLDVIIAVGYRISSIKGTEFRIWATKILRQHITKGYTINPKVLDKNNKEFLAVIERVRKLLPKENIVPAESILELIKSFASTWLSLESYDKDTLPQKGFTKKEVTVQAKDLYEDVGKFKNQLIKKKQASELFAQEKKKSALEGILGNVLQAAFGRDMYMSVEEKAAHLLYFIVKNHPFTDGNKRTGAFTFVWFLNRSGVQYKIKITPETLTAVTLLIAESNPKEKNRMVGLILLMLKK